MQSWFNVILSWAIGFPFGTMLNVAILIIPEGWAIGSFELLNLHHYTDSITKAGNAVVLSEDEYNSYVETLYLSSNPNMRKKIIEGMNTPTEDCVPESEVKW